MSRIAIRLWTLATYVLALVAVPAVTPAKATTSNGGHLNKPKKQKRPGFSDPWFTQRFFRRTHRSGEMSHPPLGRDLA
jgi:hypothetical protein